MPDFVHPSLLAGLLLVVVPVLIHLINRLRYRRVRWAAMEFLLESQKRLRTRIRLRELLLLLLRMSIISLVVLVAAEPVLKSSLVEAFSGRTVHHVILLDDSYSMSDSWAETSAFDRAKQGAVKLAELIAQQPGRHELTLVRFSRSSRMGKPGGEDMLARSVDSTLPQQVAKLLEKTSVSLFSTDCASALRAIAEFVAADKGRNTVLYVLSDFRKRDWQHFDDIRSTIQRLAAAGIRINFISCVQQQHDNLAISGLEVAGGIVAVDVPVMLEMAVKNYGQQAVRNLPVTVEIDGKQQPAVEIEEIQPGQTALQRFLVRFPKPGYAELSLRIPADHIAADNAYFLALPVVAELPVLIIDGGKDLFDAQYVSAALSPGGVNTGISPVVESPDYLRRQSPSGFATVWLLNVGYLEQSIVSRLEQYVSQGGTLVLAVGDQSEPAELNRCLYRSGSQLLPVRLEEVTELRSDVLSPAPDVEVGEHPMFRVFSGEGNRLLSALRIERYVKVDYPVEESSESGLRILAKLRNGDPLIMEKGLGKGRVIVFLTTLGPRWNNWARANPSYVVALLELQAYLVAHKQRPTVWTVGTNQKLELAAKQWLPKAELYLPTGEESISVNATENNSGSLSLALPLIERTGFYRLRLQRQDGGSETRIVAANVDTSEGDVTLQDRAVLAGQLASIENVSFRSVENLTSVQDPASLGSLAAVLSVLLLVLLLIEQWIAYVASYHSKSSGLDATPVSVHSARTVRERNTTALGAA